jgi:hypothetical protein
MAVPFSRSAFTGGEVSPDLYGRFDLARFNVACATMRNMYVGYTGGAYSRAGSMFVGYSKQTGRDYPPRLVPFQFNINQGLVLEFGDEYMRVIENGAYVTEAPIGISAITNADPGEVTIAGVTGATAATANVAAVTVSYAPGDLITVAGGSYSTPAVLAVTNTSLKSLSINALGSGYAGADTITVTGGTQSTPVQLTVGTTRVAGIPTVAAGGAGGTPGSATVTGTTGTGTPFQATVTIDGGGVMTSVDALTVVGSYTVNPTVPSAEPVTGGGLAGAQVSLTLGIATFSITNAGVFTANATGGTFTQNTTSGVGTGATFRYALFQPNALTINTAGVYTATPSNPASQASTTGSGLGATYTVTYGAVSPYVDGDWIYLANLTGMLEMNGQIVVVDNATATTFDMTDVFGNNIDTTTFGTYTAGGTAARIYTLATPYQEEDLRYLKWAQSRDVVSLCLVNQETSVEYETQDLARLANNDWTIAPPAIDRSIDAPGAPTITASASGATTLAYRVTSIDPENGTESTGSARGLAVGVVNMAATAGSMELTWDQVDTVKAYNVYKATPSFSGPPPQGVLYGYAGTTNSTAFVDNNIIPDFTQVPPTARNPFARGQIESVQVISGGSGYTSAPLTITTSTGSGAELAPVAISGILRSVIVVNPGEGYVSTDTVSVGGPGTGATAVLNVGPQTGTYPGAVSYFQQRRVYAYTLNTPDTYFMSQPGAFTNFDVRIPTIDTDAITGSPWSLQVNGIQAMIQMPGGMVALTGRAAWQLTGAGGSSFNPQPITPSSQDAQQQAFNGCHDHIPPIPIDYDILYVQAKGSIVRNLSYQYYQNIYTGADLTLNSSHMFTGYQLVDWTWCEEPYKVLWAVREDGVLLSLTYVKPQEVAGWARHDTQGLYQSVVSVTELPVDALYAAVQRTAPAGTSYMIERTDNRIWSSSEDAWCVDSGLELAQPEPAATITASSARGLGAIASYTVAAGGTRYTAGTTAAVIDDDPASTGTGATVTLTIVLGVITAAAVAVAGTGYIRPRVVITDPAESDGGSGASIVAVLDNTATFTTDPGVFTLANEGAVIRMGGGIATITNYVSATEVEANITAPIVQLVPNAPTPTPLAQPEGNWTLTTPTDTIVGLRHLAGMTVTGLYDGLVIPPTVVDADGNLDLPDFATSVVVGLGFTCQMQTVYLDPGVAPTQQGQRKNFPKVTVRLRQTRGLKMGTNQIDGATLSPMELAPTWSSLIDLPDLALPPYGSDVPGLYTGDSTETPKGSFSEHGQIAFEQSDPLPAAILAVVVAELPGDVPEVQDPKRRGS